MAGRQLIKTVKHTLLDNGFPTDVEVVIYCWTIKYLLKLCDNIRRISSMLDKLKACSSALCKIYLSIYIYYIYIILYVCIILL